MGYVFVNDQDIAVTSLRAAELVQEVGIAAAARTYAVSESKLRAFLNANGWVGKRSTQWVKGEVEQEPVSDPTPPAELTRFD